ncbi:MAG: lysylphosphatidylglycerol synthase transmembrane domain-containing protein [Hyphomicrobium sp.]
MQAEGRRWATPWRLAQAAVSLGLIGWMVSTVDKSMLAAAAVLDPVIFLLAALLFASAQIFGGLRLATLFPGEVTPRDAVVMTWAGYFLSNFLPGTIGGDVYKAVRLKSAGMTLPAAAGGLLLDRLLNTVVLVILAALTAAPVVLAMAGGIDPRLAAIAGLALAAIAAAGVHMARRQSRIGEIMTLAAGPFARLLASPGRLVTAVILSICNIGVAIIAQWIVARELGLGISLLEMAGISAVVTLLVMVPVSLNGLGLQEASFIVLLTQAGVAQESALLFSILVRMLIVVASIVGGLTFAFNRGLR